MRKQTDLGLLILRGAGLLLALTFGVQKIGWYSSALHAGIFFINRIGAADRKNGFPNPCHASYVDHVQRINRRVPHWLRIFARLLAASLALGMAGALYTSVRLGEDWLRAALYLIISVTLIFTGAGKFSLDHLLKRKKSPAGC
jgi:hypothetical protein